LECAARCARILPPSYPMSGIVAYRDLNNEYWSAPPLREIVNPYYFQNNERLPQYQAEYVLRARLKQLDNVEVRFGWTVEAIGQNADTVEVTIAECLRNFFRQAAMSSRSSATASRCLHSTATRHLHRPLHRQPRCCICR
jgi:hypothetical protein